MDGQAPILPKVGHFVPLVGFLCAFFFFFLNGGGVKTSFHPEKPSGTTSKHIQGLKTLQQLGNELWKNPQMWKTSEAESVYSEY